MFNMFGGGGVGSEPKKGELTPEEVEKISRRKLRMLKQDINKVGKIVNDKTHTRVVFVAEAQKMCIDQTKRAFHHFNDIGSVAEVVIVNSLTGANGHEAQYVKEIRMLPEVHLQDFKPGHEKVSIIHVPKVTPAPHGADGVFDFSLRLFSEKEMSAAGVLKDSFNSPQRRIAKRKEMLQEGPVPLPPINAERTAEEIAADEAEEAESGTDALHNLFKNHPLMNGLGGGKDGGKDATGKTKSPLDMFGNMFGGGGKDGKGQDDFMKHFSKMMGGGKDGKGGMPGGKGGMPDMMEMMKNMGLHGG